MSYSDNVKTQLRQRPELVQQVIRIIAVKRSLEIDVRLDGEEMPMLIEAAMREWDEWVASARETGHTEEQFAGAILKELRSDPKHGWADILRREVN